MDSLANAIAEDRVDDFIQNFTRDNIAINPSRFMLLIDEIEKIDLPESQEIETKRELVNLILSSFDSSFEWVKLLKRQYVRLCRIARQINDPELHQKIRETARRHYPKIKIEKFTGD